MVPYLFRVILSYLIFNIVQSTAIVTEISPPLDGQIKKLNEHLYIKEGEGFTFVIEQIDHGNKNTRWDYWYNHFTEENGVKDDGYKGFRASLETYKELSGRIKGHLSNPPFTFWVAYIAYNKIDPNHLPGKEGIGMYVSVLTTPNSPFVVHIGINRTRSEMKLERLPKNLSISLHSFVAQVMKQIDPNIVYLITRPVPIMEHILYSALPNSTYIYPCQTKEALDSKEFDRLLRPHLQKLADLNKLPENSVDKERQISQQMKKIRSQEINFIKAGNGRLYGTRFKGKYGDLYILPENPPIEYREKSFRLFDKVSRHILFEADHDKQTVTVRGRSVNYSNYEWFFMHNGLWTPSERFLAMDYDALASATSN